MKLGIMQPYFMPYIGYWQLMAAVDTYVIYDDVNFIKKGWINRNNILVNNTKQLFTIALEGASQNKLINEISIADDFVKLRKTIAMAYRKAPYYNDTMELLNDIFAFESKNLAKFLENSIRLMAEYLGFKTEILLSSNLDKDNSLKGQEKILDICKCLNADIYYNAIGGQELYDVDKFKANGIDLYFVKTELNDYQQFNNEFVPGLSIIDVLMFNALDEVKDLIKQYTLI